MSLPFRAWVRHRRKQGRARLIDGLDALQAGQWARAEKRLVAAADDDVHVIFRAQLNQILQ